MLINRVRANLRCWTPSHCTRHHRPLPVPLWKQRRTTSYDIQPKPRLLLFLLPVCLICFVTLFVTLFVVAVTSCCIPNRVNVLLEWSFLHWFIYVFWNSILTWHSKRKGPFLLNSLRSTQLLIHWSTVHVDVSDCTMSFWCPFAICFLTITCQQYSWLSYYFLWWLMEIISKQCHC